MADRGPLSLVKLWLPPKKLASVDGLKADRREEEKRDETKEGR